MIFFKKLTKVFSDEFVGLFEPKEQAARLKVRYQKLMIENSCHERKYFPILIKIKRPNDEKSSFSFLKFKQGHW